MQTEAASLNVPMPTHQPTPSAFVGSVRRFGPNGVLYEIIKILDDREALIRVIDTCLLYTSDAADE